jgi:hypothetical protein
MKLNTGYWMLYTGYWILDAGCWMLDAGIVPRWPCFAEAATRRQSGVGGGFCTMFSGCLMLDVGYRRLAMHFHESGRQ